MTFQKDTFQFSDLGTRILIVGLPGCGKTTLAKAVGKKLNLMHIEVDRFFWSERQEPIGLAKLKTLIQSQINESNFIIEGHYKSIRPWIADRLTGVIWVDVPRWLVLFRCLKRELRLGGFQRLIGRSGTFRFLLKNHRALCRMYKTDLQAFLKQGKVVWHIRSVIENSMTDPDIKTTTLKEL